MNLLSMDCEYSSFYSPDLNKSGELLQLAILPVINGVPEEPFNEYCRPLKPIWNAHAEKIHGISRREAEKAQHPREMADKLQAFMDKYDVMFTALGHNPKNDKNYIERLITKYGKINHWHTKVRHDWKDTMAIAKKKKSLITTENHQLGTLCNFFKIRINAHDALSDAEATFRLYDMMDSMLSANATKQANLSGLTELQQRQKYLDMKYVSLGKDGCVFITEHGTNNREALRLILQEIWSTYAEA